MGEAAVLETLLALCIGVGLAASCGFRVFVPFLVLAVAARAGLLTPAEGFAWLASWPAILALSLATLLEVVAYYVPWLDNLLDSITTPAAVVAGVLALGASVHDVDPMLKWSVAVIAGGGSAGVIKAGTAGVRGLSSIVTGGLANFVLATVEWAVSLVLSLLALVLPLLAAVISLVLVLLLGRYALRFLARWRRAWKGEPVGETPGP
jgi:hypothetical protein